MGSPEGFGATFRASSSVFQGPSSCCEAEESLSYVSWHVPEHLSSSCEEGPPEEGKGVRCKSGLSPSNALASWHETLRSTNNSNLGLQVVKQVLFVKVGS